VKYDYLIIGSGLGGLALGIILAKENKKVLILEQHYKPGGYLHSFSRKGNQFETGFHFAPELDSDQILNMYWGYLGILDKIDLLKYNPQNFHTLIFPDFKLELPSGIDNIRQVVKGKFPSESQKIDTYFDKLKELKTYFTFFNRDHKGDMDKEHKSFELTLTDFFNQLNISAELRAVLSAHSFLYGVPPKNAPLGTHAIFSNAVYSSAYDIEGGGDALINALVQSFKENGGEILLRKEVREITMNDKIATGVICNDDTHYEADNLVSAINPQTTIDLFKENPFRSVYSSRIKEMPNTSSHFGLYALIDDPSLDTVKHDTLFFPDYNIDSMYDNPISGNDKGHFLYTTIPTARLGKKDNFHIIETLSIDNWNNYSKWSNTRFGKRPEDYKEFKESSCQKVIDQLQSIFKLKKENISFYEGSTPLTNYHFTKSPSGSMYGIQHNIDQMRAPIRARTKVPNLFLTGQSLIFPGIVGVTITSFVTACEMFGMEYVFNKIDGLSNN